MRRFKWLSCGLLAVLLLGLYLTSQVRDTMDLYEAVREGMVDVEVHGSGIGQVVGTVRRRPGTRPIRILIGAGTLFGANSGSVQNMVVTDGTQVNLSAARSAGFRASVACSDLHLAVPGENDSFTVDTLPERKRDVLRLFPVANRIGVSHLVKQAAVWIVTDNADYRDLGILEDVFTRKRVINAGEAANAMMLLEKAKLDVSSRSIWSERVPICRAVVGNDFTASDWCAKIVISSTNSSWKVSHLDDENQALRVVLRNSLLAARDEETKTALINALNGSINDFDTARTIVRLLGNYNGEDVGTAVLPLLSWESTEPGGSTDLKLAVIGLLTKLHDLRTPEAVEPLTDSSEDIQIRLAAIHAIGLLGSSDELEVLKPLTAESQPRVRLAALQAIQQINRRPVAPQ